MTTVTTFREAKICVCIGIFRFTLLSKVQRYSLVDDQQLGQSKNGEE